MERRGDMGTSVASLAEHQRDLQFTYINNDRQQQRQAAATCSRQLYQATGLCRLRGTGHGARCTGRMRHHLKSGGEWQQTAGGNADAKAVGQLAMQIDFIYGCTKCLSVCGGEGAWERGCVVLEGASIAVRAVEISPREEGTLVRCKKKQRICLDINEDPRSK